VLFGGPEVPVCDLLAKAKRRHGETLDPACLRADIH